MDDVYSPAGKICSTWLWCESCIFSDAPLSFLIEAINGLVLYLKIFPPRKSPMVDPPRLRRILMLFSESTQDSICVWSFEPPLVIKDLKLWCYLFSQLYYLRYGRGPKLQRDSNSRWCVFSWCFHGVLVGV
ncbi:unnamed protein product [Eruca vesicaria subsp. sativa]|uniref:Uncharacterized protein n=1 Tax=Eruca vesicaria subsp. sativa TaxID=29727 RepID=A0ABC8KYW5_ERUVS|nr:unnamed protein product [Eruca vesicaria subsp. sativa]